MTIQKLKNYRYICRRVRQLEDELNDAEEIDRTAGSQSNFPYIKQSVKISGVPDMYIEKKNELSILKAQKMEIERFIKCIPDKRQRRKEEMTIYISGPVTGFEDTAKKRFENAAAELKKAYKTTKEKISIINPFESNAEIFRHFQTKPTHGEYMVTSMAMLKICGAIYLLNGWENSKGCSEEFAYAKEHGYKILVQG